MLHRRECSSFRISLTYDAPTGTGKTTAYTHTLPGRLVKLVTNEQVVVEFETTDPRWAAGSRSLADARGGTDVLAAHDGVPRSLSTADSEAVCWQMSCQLAGVTRETRGGRRGGLEHAPYVLSCDC